MAITDEQTRSRTTAAYVDAATRRVTADTAIEYAYRDLGEGDVRWCCCSTSAATSTTGTRR